jgi:hypothetical protein
MTCPQVTIPVLQIPQPDGSILVKAGKPVVVEASISTREAARLLGMSPRWVMKECDLGRFKTAYKPGRQPTSQWRLLRTEVLARKKAEPA